MDKEKVLFVCVHNSARSQMAEALLNKIAGDRFEAHSAGLEPGKLNSLAVESLKEIGINISGKATQEVLEIYKNEQIFSHVITVCDETSGARCPIFPGITKRIHWSFDDPSKFEGTPEEKISRTNQVRNAIKKQIEEWVKEV